MHHIYKILLISVLLATSVQAWFDTDWPYRAEFTVTEADGVTLTDQQVEVALSAADFNTSYAWSTAGQDLRVLAADDTTPLDFFIEAWDQGAQTARVQVKIPSLAPNATTSVFLYVGNTAVATASDATTALTEVGLRYHTRNSNFNPANKTQAVNAFNGLPDTVAGYGCATVTNFTNIRNSNLFGTTNSNIAFFSNHHFEVTAATQGVWQFRFGGDYGRGGGLYVDDVPLEEDWNNDLWWAFNFGNPDVLQGSTGFLNTGYHTLQLIGFEGCCDGGTTVQFQNPTTGGWTAWSTANATIRSEKCLLTAVNTAHAITPNLATSTKTWVDQNGGNLVSADVLRYTITLNESNNVEAQNVRVLDDMPALVGSLSVVSIPAGATDNSTVGGGANGTGLLDVSGINVPANGSVSIVFDVTLASITSSTTINNLANLTNSGGVTNITVNAPPASAITNPLFVVSKTSDISTGNPGDLVTYTITVTNTGTGTATNVLLNDDMSSHTNFRVDSYGAGVHFQCSSGCPASGLSLGIATYSDDDAATFAHTPISGNGGAPVGFDAEVTDWRLPMTGTMNPNGASFSIQYQSQIK